VDGQWIQCIFQFRCLYIDLFARKLVVAAAVVPVEMGVDDIVQIPRRKVKVSPQNLHDLTPVRNI
jgi:hypothetical protein